MGPTVRYAVAGLGVVMMLFGMGSVLLLRQGGASVGASRVLGSRLLAWAAVIVGISLVGVSLFVGDFATTRPPVFLD